MRKFFILASLVVLGLWFPGTLLVNAAEPPRLTEANLSVWPEYDEPGVLVIVAGRLPADTPLPTTLRLLIPTGATLNAAAFENEKGTLVHADVSRKAADTPGWDVASFEVSSVAFQFEYYHNTIKGGPDKSISLDYQFLYPVDTLTVEAQQPLRATNFVTKPETKDIVTGGGGFRFYRFSYSKIDAGKALPLEISYTKADNEPSITRQAPEPLSPPEPETGTNWTTIGLIIAAVAVFAVFLLVVVRRRSAEATPAPMQRMPSPAAAATAAQRRHGAATQPAQPSFCPNCGERLGANVNFCPRCGERIE